MGLVLFFIIMFFYAMSTRLELLAAKGKRPGLQELIDAGWKYWLRLSGLLLISILIIFIGLILLIVPGVIAFGRLIFAHYVMVDKDLGIADSIKESNRLVKGRASFVWGAIGVMVLVSLAAAILGEIPILGGALAAIVGIGFSLIIVLRYLQIKKVAGAS
jgi:uncharacterized membrane protein